MKRRNNGGQPEEQQQEQQVVVEHTVTEEGDADPQVAGFVPMAAGTGGGGEAGGRASDEGQVGSLHLLRLGGVVSVTLSVWVKVVDFALEGPQK